MNNRHNLLPPQKPVPTLPAKRNGQALSRPSLDAVKSIVVQYVQVRAFGERRRDHYRRWLTRGIDELRRQHLATRAPPPPEPGEHLDELI